MDEQVRNQCRSKLKVNRFESQACDSDELMECLSGDEHVLDVQLVGDRIRALGGSVRDRR